MSNNGISVTFEELINTVKDIKELKKDIKSIQIENQELRAKLNELECMVSYAPPTDGGAMYKKTKKHFEDLQRKRKFSQST